MLTTCIASTMRSMIDIAFIVNLLLIWSIQFAAVIWVFCILTKRPCVAAMLKYFAFLAFLAVSLRRCVALQSAEVGMMLGHVLTNQTEIFYLSWYSSNIIGKMFISFISFCNVWWIWPQLGCVLGTIIMVYNGHTHKYTDIACCTGCFGSMVYWTLL